MVSIDLSGKTALITGGTQGIGKAAGLHLSRAGADVFLTCKWGSADEDKLKQEFVEASGTEPHVVEADVANDDDTDALLETIAEAHESVDLFVSNVGFAPQIRTLGEYKKKSFFRTLEYSSWPIIEYTNRIKTRFGKYPSRIVGISSDGPSHYYRGYDFVSAAKALLEHFARYLSAHLLSEGCRVNVIRFGTVKTESFDAIFGNSFLEFLKLQGVSEELVLTPDECGKAVLALESGLLDAMNGQIVTVDYGLPFQDNLMMRFLDWKEQYNTTEQGAAE